MYLAPCLTISAMASLLKYFKQQSLPMSEEIGLSEVATKEENVTSGFRGGTGGTCPPPLARTFLALHSA